MDHMIQSLNPAGTIRSTIAATADPGWFLLDGSTVTNGQSLYPGLWAVIPAAWKSGANIILSDARGKFLVMDDAGAVFTLGVAGGANSKTIASGNLPVHTHTIDHSHSTGTSLTENQYHVHTATNWLSGNVTSDHTHTGLSGLVQASPSATGIYMTDNGTVLLYVGYGPSSGISANHQHYTSGSTDATHTLHTHNFTTPAFSGASGNGGFANTALDITPANLVVNYQIKAH
jgi:microcystin-dependent protein